jgi:hypothetical protein
VISWDVNEAKSVIVIFCPEVTHDIGVVPFYESPEIILQVESRVKVLVPSVGKVYSIFP